MDIDISYKIVPVNIDLLTATGTTGEVKCMWYMYVDVVEAEFGPSRNVISKVLHGSSDHGTSLQISGSPLQYTFS